MIGKVFKMKYLGFSTIIFLCLISVSSCNDKDDMSPSQILGGIALSSSEVVLSPCGGDYYLTFSSDNDWNIDGDIPEWLSIDNISGKSGIANIKLTAPINETKQDREVYLTFNVGKGNDNPKIHISQDFPYLIAKDVDLNFLWDYSAQYEAKAIDYPIESNVKWKFVHVEGNGGSWYSISTLDGNGDIMFLVKVSLAWNYCNIFISISIQS